MFSLLYIDIYFHKKKRKRKLPSQVISYGPITSLWLSWGRSLQPKHITGKVSRYLIRGKPVKGIFSFLMFYLRKRKKGRRFVAFYKHVNTNFFFVCNVASNETKWKLIVCVKVEQIVKLLRMIIILMYQFCN